ncbi:hypothetical protein PACTADRAFT_76813 [Pachysolen tannophilus NRRL Y-2460]|uniref:TOM70 n=1 Tax=Pachysolen tannophilus NRRL Y-2460 TaxID=669874 RepID=A0A1E4TR80_PACTA|nr:hypothetical protein PACTADRAFT_76813 [Pachysolen tannophilus NRRL Y-2460]
MSSVAESQTFWDRASRFASTHRSAIALTAAVGTSTAIGAYLYFNSQSQSLGLNPDVSSSASKKKKKKKKKSGAATGTNSPSSPSSQEAKRKKNWALALKEEGNVAFKAKKYEDAITYYSFAIKCDEDPVFYSNRSACYVALDDNENVIADTTKALKLKPDYSKCLVRRAQAYENLEKYTDAMFDLTALTIYGGFNNKTSESMLETNLKKQSAKVVQAKLADRVPSLPTAGSITAFFEAFIPETTVEGLDEDNVEGDKFLAEGLRKLQLNTPEGYDAADVAFKQACDRYGTDLTSDSPDAKKAAIAFEYLGAMQFLKNEIESSLKSIDYAISLNARPKGYVLLALIHADKSDLESANKYFDMAHSLNDQDPDIYYHIGQLYYLTQDLERAKENFIKAKELNPENVYAYIQLACIAYRNGQVEDAKQKFQDAKKKFPTSPEIPNYYGEILLDSGDEKGALKQFDVAAGLQKNLPTFSIGAVPLVNKAALLVKNPANMDEIIEILDRACKIDPKSESARSILAQVKLQQGKVEEAIKLFEEAADLARGYEDKLQATSFAEAAKMQLKIREDPNLSKKVEELMAHAQLSQFV